MGEFNINGVITIKPKRAVNLDRCLLFDSDQNGEHVLEAHVVCEDMDELHEEFFLIIHCEPVHRIEEHELFGATDLFELPIESEHDGFKHGGAFNIRCVIVIRLSSDEVHDGIHEFDVTGGDA